MQLTILTKTPALNPQIWWQYNAVLSKDEKDHMLTKAFRENAAISDERGKERKQFL
jgi:hypothetical protein